MPHPNLHLVPPQAASLVLRILLLLPPALPAELRRVGIPPPEAHLDVVALRKVGDATEVGREVAPEYGLPRRLRFALPYLLVPRPVEELVLGEEEVSFVLVALFIICTRREGGSE